MRDKETERELTETKRDRERADRETEKELTKTKEDRERADKDKGRQRKS